MRPGSLPYMDGIFLRARGSCRAPDRPPCESAPFRYGPLNWIGSAFVLAGVLALAAAFYGSIAWAAYAILDLYLSAPGELPLFGAR